MDFRVGIGVRAWHFLFSISIVCLCVPVCVDLIARLGNCSCSAGLISLLDFDKSFHISEGLSPLFVWDMFLLAKLLLFGTLLFALIDFVVLHIHFRSMGILCFLRITDVFLRAFACYMS